MGGYEINPSLSVSASATSGAQSHFSELFGDFVVGRGARNSDGLPAWIVPAGIAALVIVAVVFLVRRK